MTKKTFRENSLMDVATRIAKSSRFKKAILSEEANELDLSSIFVDFGIAVFQATKEVCHTAYRKSMFMNTMDIKKFIKDAEFPSKITFAIR